MIRLATWWVMLLAAAACCWSARAQEGVPVSVPAGRAARNVAVITLRGEIDHKGVMAQSVRRRIDAAARDGADAIVFELDTPGGSVPTVLKICEAVRASPVKNTVAWVNPQAYSGGAVIALACREIVVSGNASFGDAMPILMNPMGMLTGMAKAPTDRELLKKVLPPLIAEVTQSARAYNTTAGAYLRDEYLVQSIVANDVELWYVRNRETGVRMCIDRAEFEMLFPGASTGGPTRLASQASTGKLELRVPEGSRQGVPVPAGSAKMAIASSELSVVAPSLRPRLSAGDAGAWELIDKVKDGSLPAVFKAEDMEHYGLANNDAEASAIGSRLRPIDSDADLKAYFGAMHVQRYEPTWSEGLVDLLTNIVVQALLVAIFLIAVFVQMLHPGSLAAGVASTSALVLLIAPGMLIGMASWWEVLAIFSGLALIALEIFVIPGFGVPGVLGLALLLAGLVGLFVPAGTGPFPDTPEGRRDLLRGGVALLMSLGTAGVAMYFIAKHFSSIPFLGRLVLSGPGSEESDLLGAMDDDRSMTARVGQTGRAVTPMRPAGRVELGDVVIDAVAEFGFIEAGASVRVVKVDGMRIAVEVVVGDGSSAKA
ncbi:MAG: NfeD family protein [Phycisphaerae bacterium]